ncbi:MAG: T9SS type A sorting domain-containing protein [Saprospiraceae bacterium]
MNHLYPDVSPKAAKHLCPLLFLVLSIFSFNNELSAQCPVDYTLDSQAKVDSFPILFPQCKELEGVLTINGDDITNLQALSGLTSAENLTIQFNSQLSSLSGLDNLEKIPGHFVLNVNNGLESLDGLQNLDSIGGSFYMNNNHDLLDLEGLSSLHTVGGKFSIIGTSELQNMAGLENLHKVGQFFISNNYSLTTMAGLEGLREVDELSLIGNYNENFDAFVNLDTIGKLLYIADNFFLTDISGFENLDVIAEGYVTIKNNGKLSNCAAYAICAAIALTPAKVHIANNKPGCDNSSEVSSDCLNIFNFNAAKGKVYADLDCNGNFDSTDVVLPNHFIRNATTLNPWAVTNPEGQYTQLLPPQSTTIIVPDSITGYSPYPPADTFTTGSVIHVFTDRDFRFCPDSLFHNLSLTAIPVTVPVRGFPQHYQLCVSNFGAHAENATLTFTLTDTTGQNSLEFQYLGGGTLDNYTITWEIENLKPFEKQCFNFSVLVSPAATLGAEFEFKAEVQTVPLFPDTEPDNNVVITTQTIVGSFDPNDKNVEPKALHHDETTDGNWLDYLIRFQNTGNFPATFVEVLDTLENSLDFRTLEMQAASHDYVLSFPEEGILKWRFDNINLPDSTSDEPNSHGYIAFRIKTMPGLALDKVVRNRAGIYFDFNEVVLTNYAETSFFLVSTVEPSRNSAFLEVFPNPSKQLIVVKKASAVPEKAHLFSPEGKLLKALLLTGKETAVDLSGLPDGLLVLITESGAVAKVLKR